LLAPSSDRPSDDASPDGTSQFALFERVTELLEDVSARRPLVLVVDDLQWADAASLRLLVHVVERRMPGVVTLGALRDRAPVPGAELGKALAAIGRMAGHRRITLPPMSIDEVAELIGFETGCPPSAAVTRRVYQRTDGNPLFVRELSRLLSSAGTLDGGEVGYRVPSTIRDVVQDLSSGLDDEARELLQLASRAEFNGNPPAAVANWLEEQGVAG
jgi:predicted ATPase